MQLHFQGQQLLQKLSRPELKSCGLNATANQARPNQVVVHLAATQFVSTAAKKATSPEIALYNKERGAIFAEDMAIMRQTAEPKRRLSKLQLLLLQLLVSSFMATVKQ